MGYGYLGSYLAFGFLVDDNEFEDGFEDFYELGYHENNSVFVKKFGYGEDYHWFLCWKKVFRGGEYWHPDFMSETSKCSHTITLEQLQEIEESYPEDLIRKICLQYNWVNKKPFWQTLITVGPCLY